MKISEDVRKYAREKGIDDDDEVLAKMAEKSKEFIDSGSQLYLSDKK